MGFARRQIILDIWSDTTVTIILRIDPVLLPAVTARARKITVRGRVFEHGTGRPVTEGSVFVTPGRHTHTNLDGSFKFGDVPANVPVEFAVRAFSFEPFRFSITASKDTSVELHLDVDTTIQRLISEQHRKLDTRMIAVVGKAFSVPREEILGFVPANLFDALRGEFGILNRYLRSGHPQTLCVFVDEQLAPTNDPERFMFPQEIERVEIFEEGRMLRIYTRRYMERLITEPPALGRPGYSEVPPGFRGHAPAQAFCR